MDMNRRKLREIVKEEEPGVLQSMVNLYTLELVFLWERFESFLEVGH